MEQTVEQRIAKDLLEIEAVFLRPDEPFTWASGIKSPIYCDNRLTLTSPSVRQVIEEQLAALIMKEFPEVELLMGTATAGIPHAAIVGHLLQLPMGYVRGKAKSHGRVNQIEGRLPKGAHVVVVEDLISTGGSSLDAVEALRDAGAEVLGIVSIFTYGMQLAQKNMAKHHVQLRSLTNLDALVQVAHIEGYIKEIDIERILKFRDNPQDTRWIHHA
ncbi:orotate phosphoribosyltransferase [Allofustis seminis]|uniref:orotate phosphoribosyltransferase n=1 Tax=Allofustis seminis TaxID=166939 RepID=UPI0003792E6B|nr:orotate phosphoribosyltransferase [Allofustis seminis]